MTDTDTLPKRLRAFAAERAGDGPSGPLYDPELLSIVNEAADAIDALASAWIGEKLKDEKWVAKIKARSNEADRQMRAAGLLPEKAADARKGKP